jgi:hypothetical protein
MNSRRSRGRIEHGGSCGRADRCDRLALNLRPVSLLEQGGRAAVDEFPAFGLIESRIKNPVHVVHGARRQSAFVLDGKPQLIEFGSIDFQPEIKNDNLHFVAMGSGQVLVEPFMAFVSRVLWGGKPPDVQLGDFGLYWVLSHTIQYAPGGVGKPIKIAILKKEKGNWVARSVEGDELQEPEQHVAEIEKLIGRYPKAVVEGETKATPPPHLLKKKVHDFRGLVGTAPIRSPSARRIGPQSRQDTAGQGRCHREQPH